MPARMAQLDQTNQLPINQEAKRWLQVENLNASPDSLYLFQLMHWGLDPDGGHLYRNQPARLAALQEYATALRDSQTPETALEFVLLEQEEPDPNLTVEQLSSQRTTKQAAHEALEALDRALIERLENYPPKE